MIAAPGGSTTTDFTYLGEQLESATTGGTTQRYHYDPLGRLDCITLPGGTTADCLVGESASPKLLADYTYDALDRLTAHRSFDTNGSTSEKNDDATYVYDALDRLVKESESHKGSSPGTRDARTTTFAHIGTSALVAKETIVPASGANITKSFSYDANGHRISMTRTEGAATEVFTYGYDVHGSTSLLLDSSGSPKASYGYTPYGELDTELSKGDTSEDDPFNAYRYSGKRFDSGSESIDMGARRFAPGSARFLQQDMFMGALADLSLSSDPLTANRYSLAGGNPVGYMEWDGHAPITDGNGGAGLASMKKLYAEGSIKGGGFASGGGARGGVSDGGGSEELGLDARELYKAYGQFGSVVEHIPTALKAAEEFGIGPRLLVGILLLEGEGRQRLLEPAEWWEAAQAELQENPSIGIGQMKFTTFLATTVEHHEKLGIPREFGNDPGRRQAFVRRLQNPRQALRYSAAYLASIQSKVRSDHRGDLSILAGTYNAGLPAYREDFLQGGQFGSSADTYRAAFSSLLPTIDVLFCTSPGSGLCVRN